MFYQYALFKPFANIKIGFPATGRQIVPLLLLAALVIGGILGIIFRGLDWIFFSVAAIYLLADILVSFYLAIKYNLVLFFYLVILFPAIHFSYAVGYALGIWNFVILKKRFTNIELSR